MAAFPSRNSTDGDAIKATTGPTARPCHRISFLLCQAEDARHQSASSMALTSPALCQRFTAPPQSSRQSPLHAAVPARGHSCPTPTNGGDNRTVRPQDPVICRANKLRGPTTKAQTTSPFAANNSAIKDRAPVASLFSTPLLSLTHQISQDQQAGLCYSITRMNKSYHASPSMSVRYYAISPAQFEASDHRRAHASTSRSNQYSSQKQKPAFSIMPGPVEPSASTATAWCRRCHATMSLDHCSDPRAMHGSTGKHSSYVADKDGSSSSFPPLKRQDATVGQGGNLR
ncbi:hypothetical protein B0H67DRAFT_560875 [Lasiosphaeris hirsuta]|uniref:Uncharacterized protein n=1 Tax=Lasiosphaeris hirsuta TaxID=260670 RepID=A0AA40B9J9_9PEZI|nr:hypothetical protein B0H67DRAFT_560875 [Lasiosphaeris hirsuta]